MSEPTKVTIGRRTYAVLDPTPRGDGWMLWVDDDHRQIPGQAAAVLHFLDHERTGTATLDNRVPLAAPDGFRRERAMLTVTLDPR